MLYLLINHQHKQHIGSELARFYCYGKNITFINYCRHPLSCGDNAATPYGS